MVENSGGTEPLWPSGKSSAMNGQSDTPHSSNRPTVKPLWLCSLIVRRYRSCFALTLGMHIFLIVLSAILVVMGYNLFPIAFTETPVNIRDSDQYLRMTAWNFADENDDIIGKDTSWAVIGERSRVSDTLQVMFEGVNVLTSERLRAMKQVEKELVGHRDYINFCRLNYTADSPACFKTHSILRFFDASYGISDPDFQNISETLRTAYQTPALRGALLPLVGENAILNGSEASASIVRFVFELGKPLKGYDLRSDDRKDQNKLLEDFQVDAWSSLLDRLARDGISGMNVYYSSDLLMEHAIIPEVYRGLYLAAGSLIFIFLVVLCHTGSLLITCLVLFSIINSFIGTNLLYNLVFRYEYIGVFHVMALFIILGIGADDIFVFIDSWRAAGLEGYTTLEERLTVCYKKASKANLITSLTTFVAFISNAFNPLLMTSSFGVFAATLVLFNYLNVTLFFPTVVILHHNMVLEDKTWPCFRKCTKEADEANGKQGLVVRFFKGPVFSFITHKILRWVILAIMVGQLACFIYFATRLEPSRGIIQMFKSDHNFEKAADRITNSFVESANNDLEVYLVWGLKNQDFSACNSKGTGCDGKTIWDDSFGLNSQQAQAAILNLCHDIRDMTGTQAERLKLKRRSEDGKVDMDCFIDNMDTYMAAKEGIRIPYNATNILPVVMKYPNL